MALASVVTPPWQAADDAACLASETIAFAHKEGAACVRACACARFTCMRVLVFARVRVRARARARARVCPWACVCGRACNRSKGTAGAAVKKTAEAAVLPGLSDSGRRDTHKHTRARTRRPTHTHTTHSHARTHTPPVTHTTHAHTHTCTSHNCTDTTEVAAVVSDSTGAAACGPREPLLAVQRAAPRCCALRRAAPQRATTRPSRSLRRRTQPTRPPAATSKLARTPETP